MGEPASITDVTTLSRHTPIHFFSSQHVSLQRAASGSSYALTSLMMIRLPPIDMQVDFAAFSLLAVRLVPQPNLSLSPNRSPNPNLNPNPAVHVRGGRQARGAAVVPQR